MFLAWNVSLLSMAAAEAILDNPEEVAEKIFLKRISPIHGKGGYFRVTPGLDEENERFLKFIKDYFG